MSYIEYISDHELKYKYKILKSIQEYNKAQTGERKTDELYIYAFKNNKLVGGLHTEQEWDWTFITKQFYGDTDILNAMINEMNKYYKNSVVGIQYNTNNPEIITAFKQSGFYVLGSIQNMPKGKDMVYLLNTNLSQIITNTDIIIKSSNEDNIELKKSLNSLIPKDNRKKEDLEYIALDGEKFVGGVYGFIKDGYLYINLIVVEEHYRGKNIATKLMDLIYT
jgi:hypothetical protein